MRDFLDRLDGWRDEQIEFLARLVNHDSGTDDVIDVNRVGAILVERLERLGFAVRRVVNDRFGDHLVGDKPGTGPKRFLFVGHYDTVFPSGTAKQRPFRIDAQGRAWGPGVYDMKGGLTALLYALRAHQEARTRTWAETSVSVVFNADEERLSPTSREVIGQEARRAHSVGILEPARPGGEYVMARKGAGTFQLEVTGKAAHAGLQPELGASAIWDLAQKVAALHALTDFDRGHDRQRRHRARRRASQRRRRPRRGRDRSARMEPGRGRDGHRRHAEDLRPAARRRHDARASRAR